MNWLQHCKRLNISTKNRCISRSEFLQKYDDTLKTLKKEIKVQGTNYNAITASIMFSQYKGSVCQLKPSDFLPELKKLCLKHEPPILQTDGIPISFSACGKVFPPREGQGNFCKLEIVASGCKGTLVWNQHDPEICTTYCQQKSLNRTNYGEKIDYFESYKINFPKEKRSTFHREKIPFHRCLQSLIIYSGKNTVPFSKVTLFFAGVEIWSDEEHDCRIIKDDPRWHAISMDSKFLSQDVFADTQGRNCGMNIEYSDIELEFEHLRQDCIVYGKEFNVIRHDGAIFCLLF